MSQPAPENVLADPFHALRFATSDLVVALEHRAVVEQALVALEVWSENPPPSRVVVDDRLGLARLTLDRPERCQDRVREKYSEQFDALRDELDELYTPLDAVLLRIRLDALGEFGGWQPLMGKNRNVSSVLPWPGGGSHNPLAVGDPGFFVPEQDPWPRTGRAGTGVGVGLVDAPLYPHRRLAGHVSDGELAFAALHAARHDEHWQAWEGHATFVADRILERAPGAWLEPRAALGGPNGTATAWDTARAMAGFVGGEVAVLNLSLGCRTADGRPPLVLTRAVERLTPSVLLVAAAGNHGATDHSTAAIWPAALPTVVAVAATEQEGSEFSPNLPWITCAAPGVGVVGAYLDEQFVRQPKSGLDAPYSGYATWSGTSFAAATVSGAVAAAMTDGRTAAEALDELLRRPDGIVRPFTFRSPTWPPSR